MPTISTSGLEHQISWMNNDPLVTSIPVDLSSTTYRTLFRLARIACSPGDVFIVHGEASVTSDVGRDPETMAWIGKQYNVGIGFHVWYYDEDYVGPLTLAQRHIQIGTAEGENVTPAGHHLPMDITRWLKVPDSWIPGHRITIVMRADAHASSWDVNKVAIPGGEVVKVDPHGLLSVQRWVPRGADKIGQLESQLADAQSGLESLAARVAALEPAPPIEPDPPTEP